MLVGRESERRTIGTLLAGARVGDSRVLVLSGEPGIGKTTLLTDAETQVGDMRVLRARCVEAEQYVPFAGLLQLLRPLLPLLDHVPAPQAAALSSALLLGETDGSRPSRFAVGAATLSVLARGAEDRPLAVLVDDAHLMDSSSAEALVFAARRLLSDAVALIATVRADEPTAALWATLPTLVVTGLDRASAEQLVSRTVGPLQDQQLARLHEATAGNPLGLLELGAHVEDLEGTPHHSVGAVSERISRSFAGRTAGLSEDGRLGLLVCAADSTSLAVVGTASAALGLREGWLVEAEDAGLVSLRDDRVEFRHPLVRSAVYGAADAETRRSVHRALAAAIPRHETARLAWHLSRSASAPDEATAATLDEVGAQASRRGAHAIAASAHERAAGLTPASGPVAARLAAAGEAAWLAGLTERAVHLLDRAVDAGPEPMLRAHVQEIRGAVETRCGSLETALPLLVDAATTVEGRDPDQAIRMLADAVHVAFYLAATAEGLRLSSRIDRLLESAADPHARYLGSVASGMALILSGDGARGVERLREAAYQLAVPDDVPADEFRLPLRLQGALWLRDAGPQRDVVNDAIARLREQAALGSLPYVLMHIARDAATTDRWDDAESAYVEGIRLARETGQTTDLAMSLGGLAMLQARRGSGESCVAGAAEAGALAQRHHIRMASFWATFALGDLAAGRGEVVAAVEHYERLTSSLASTAFADPDQSCGPELVECYAHLGRLDEARVAAEESMARAAAKGQPWALARAERALGLCSSGASQEAHFEQALALHAETLDGYERARTELSFGSRLRRDRRRVDARPLLRSALTTFERLGAAPWADRAAQELQATGETVHRHAVDARDELTPQERQIAQLLAAGRTTREAAAALFISPKTVEYHLRHVYLKLDIRSRVELAEVLGR